MDECKPLARGEAAAARDALSSTAAEGADGLKAGAYIVHFSAQHKRFL